MPTTTEKPATPVADHDLATEVRKLTAHLLALSERVERANQTRARDVAKGVFFGSLAVGLLLLVLSIFLGGLLGN